MATDYALNLKATLDTSEAEAKLQQLANGKSGSGTSGATAFNSLEKSIQKLNASIDKLNSAASKPSGGGGGGGASSSFSQQYGPLLRLAAGHYVGGALVNMAGQQVASGNTGYGIAAGTAGGMLQGAAAGMAFGPAGAAVGAAVGGLNQALSLLAKSAEQATAALLEQVKVQQKQIKDFHTAEKGVKREQELREFAALSDEELIRITKELPAAKTMLEEFTTGEIGKKFASEYRGPDFVGERDKRLKEYQAAIEKAAYRAQAAQELLDKRGMLSIYGTQSTAQKLPALAGLLGTTSSQANVGYDVGGYGGFASIEQN